jgi:hypothetical protein
MVRDVMTLLWLSKHSPTPSQRAELTRLFGDHELRIDPQPFSDAGDVARRIRRSGASEVVVVAPLAVLRKLLEFGFAPLTADMEQCRPEEAEIQTPGYLQGRHYKFRKFRRLRSITLEYEDIETLTNRK